MLFSKFTEAYCSKYEKHLSIVAQETVRSLQLTEDFEEVSVQSRGFGLLDVGYRSKVRALSLN